VVALLDTAPGATGAIASGVVSAAESRLRELANDEGVAEAFRVVIRMTWTARSDEFLDELRSCGIANPSDGTALSVIADLGEHVRRTAGEAGGSAYFGEIAALATRTALTNTVGRQGPSLFASSVEDLQRSFRAYSTKDRFGELARRFFADFLSRSMRSWVDRELSNRLGHSTAAAADSQTFLRALETHTWQAARIVEDFAGGWYSKRNFELSGEIDRTEARKFVAVALRKLRSELKAGAT
jgi:hypothetical protein